MSAEEVGGRTKQKQKKKKEKKCCNRITNTESVKEQNHIRKAKKYNMILYTIDYLNCAAGF